MFCVKCGSCITVLNDNELCMMWNVVVLAYFKVLTKTLLGGTDKNYKKPQLRNRVWSLVLLKLNLVSGVLTPCALDTLNSLHLVVFSSSPLWPIPKSPKHLSLTNIMRLSQSTFMQVEWLDDWSGMEGSIVEAEVMGSGQSTELLSVAWVLSLCILLYEISSCRDYCLTPVISRLCSAKCAKGKAGFLYN